MKRTRSTELQSRSPWEIRSEEDEREIDLLCKGLTGLRSTRLAGLIDQIKGLGVPEGIHTIRLHESISEEHFASIANDNPGGLRADDVAISVALCGHYRWHSWVSTEAMPARQRGVLDLAICFRRRILPLLRQA